MKTRNDIFYMQWMETLVYMILYVLLGIVVFFVIYYFFDRPSRWRQYGLLANGTHVNIIRVLKKASVRLYSKKRFEQYRRLLAGSGISLNPSFYLFARTVCVIGVVMLFLFSYSVTGSVLHFSSLTFITIAMLIGVDRWLIEQIRRRRAKQITEEVFTLSHHLIYYQGSRLNIHTKLMRCLPFTRTIQKELNWLLSEWYEDAEQALERFKYRLGTEEAHSFVETLRSLRTNDDSEYYQLLRERMLSYKEKLALEQESRSEKHSYVLFVLAGIPLLNTFRVFIYPWVEEGKRLFESLH